ncbi:MAG: helix repeat-containing protein [Ilumatobacteraceae bacterium]|nr:helix repeat-containing protein [Ilumatobacteraceae bacterium]
MIAKIEWSDGIQKAWNDVASFVPRLIGFLIVLILGYIVAKAISKALNAILDKVGFDKAVERGGVKSALAKSKFDASDIVAKLIFYGLFLLVLQMAFGVFGKNPISDLLRSVIAYIPRVLVAIIIIVIASAIGAAVRELVDASLSGLSYGRTLGTAAGAAILVIGTFAALNELLIAPQIVTGLFYALLAIIVGSAVIAIGGGGILPMRERWTNVLAKYDEEKPKIQQASQGAKDRIQSRAQTRIAQAKTIQNQPND